METNKDKKELVKQQYSELALNDNIARLVPLYHSLGTMYDTLVVPLLAGAGTGTKRVL